MNVSPVLPHLAQNDDEPEQSEQFPADAVTE